MFTIYTVGTVTGFLHKIPLQVIGDGVSTLEQLVLQSTKGEKHAEAMFAKHEQNWHNIINKAEVVIENYKQNSK